MWVRDITRLENITPQKPANNFLVYCCSAMSRGVLEVYRLYMFLYAFPHFPISAADWKDDWKNGRNIFIWSRSAVFSSLISSPPSLFIFAFNHHHRRRNSLDIVISIWLFDICVCNWWTCGLADYRRETAMAAAGQGERVRKRNIFIIISVTAISSSLKLRLSTGMHLSTLK